MEEIFWYLLECINAMIILFTEVSEIVGLCMYQL